MPLQLQPLLCCCCTACLPRMSRDGLLVLVCDNPLLLLLRHPGQGPKGELQRTFHHLVKLEKVRRGCPMAVVAAVCACILLGDVQASSSSSSQ